MSTEKPPVTRSVEAILRTLPTTDSGTNFYLAFISENGHNWTGCDGDMRDMVNNIVYSCEQTPELSVVILNAAKIMFSKDSNLLKEFMLDVLASTKKAQELKKEIHNE